MKAIHILFIIVINFMLVGCSNRGTTVSECMSKGYKGIVINADLLNPDVYCSDGELSSDGLGYKTSNGVFIIKQEYFGKFNKPYYIVHTYVKF